MSLTKTAVLVALVATAAAHLGRAQTGAQPAQKAAPVKVADVFIPMPNDIHCYAREFVTTLSTNDRGELTRKPTSAKRLTCSISGTRPGQEKEIPLASTQINDGMLPTKDFGSLKITFPPNPTNLMSSGVAIAIRRDKLQSFREFLQK